MEKLFGIPTNQIMLILLVAFLVAVGALAITALRNRIMLKLGIRNIPRRPAQTTLIILGLMLGTLIISAAFTTGDTVTNTIRMTALRYLGPTDEVVSLRKGNMMNHEAGSTGGSFGDLGAQYFDVSVYDRIHEVLAGTGLIDGIAPVVSEKAPVVNPVTRLNEPQVNIFAPQTDEYQGLASLSGAGNGRLPLDVLKGNEVYINRRASKLLKANPGGELTMYLRDKPVSLFVKGIVEDKDTLLPGPTIIMKMGQAQDLFGSQGKITGIVISNNGGVKFTDEVISTVQPAIEGSTLEVQDVKRQTLDAAELMGNMFATVFVVFGMFSIAAGVMLIFLIFVMLAAERKPEMGMARAVGTKRRHLVEIFLFEGTVYDLVAAAVGSILGVAVGYGMVRLMMLAFSSMMQNVDVSFLFRPRSLIIAYTLGMLLTFLTVSISAWRVSILNIVRAIRDLPDPRQARASRRLLLFSILGLFLGIIMTVSGLSGKQLAPFMLGTSVIIICLGALLRQRGVSDRISYTFVGAALLAWWLLPYDAYHNVVPEMKQGIEMFFLSGIMIVAGAVWLIMYNSDLLLRGLTGLAYTSARLRRLSPVIKMAVSYPMNNKFRTGMTLAMFSLVIFTIIVMSVLTAASSGITKDKDAVTGGFHIQVTSNYNNPITDMRAAIASTNNIRPDDIEVVARQSIVPAETRQVGAEEQEFKLYAVQGLDDSYLDNTTFNLGSIANGYGSTREVWQAIKTTAGLAVIDAMVVPSKNQYQMGGQIGESFRVEGIYAEDKTFEPFDLEVKSPITGAVSKLKVIGILRQNAIFSFGAYTNQQTANQILGLPLAPTTYLLRLKKGADAEAIAANLEADFLQNGVHATVLADEINDAMRTNNAMNYILEGFMALGLLVGIAALGVISARSVVERRQQIGMLRAIGFQRGMVQLSFLMESSFVAILGIVIGIVLGLSLSYNIVDFVAKTYSFGFTYDVPWLEVAVIAVLAYGASLLTTFLPARQAAGIYPAEALRYE